MRPHNLPLVMIGAGLLWFGWFGFNAGSAVASNGVAGITFINTTVATCAAMLGWLLVERIRDGRPTSLGAASGVVAGLVAITPSCSSVSPLGAIALGAIAGAVCALAVSIKFRFGFDDSLDVVGVHLIGGLAGTLLVGFLATASAPAGVNGLFYGGGLDQLWRQAVAAFAVMIYSFVGALIIALVLKYTIGLRLDREAEQTGIDETEHAEAGYELSAIFTGSGSSNSKPAPALPTGKVSASARQEG
jgi:Amt family ammonium transporter